MIAAVINGTVTAYNKTDNNKVVGAKEYHMSKKLEGYLGDGNAEVGAKRGFVSRRGTISVGLIVEASFTVKLTCNQDKETILECADEAGVIAENLALDALGDMESYLVDRFGEFTE
jgi:hypothetical protein